MHICLQACSRVTAFALTVQEVLSKIRGITAIQFFQPHVGHHVPNLIILAFVCVLCPHSCTSEPLDFIVIRIFMVF